MSSIYNIVAPTINPTATSSYSLKLHGNVETDSVSSVSGGNIQFNNNIQINNVLGTSSWAANLPWQSSAYLITSSWADTAKNLSGTATYASYLIDSAANGTASYARNAKTADIALSAASFTGGGMAVKNIYQVTNTNTITVTPSSVGSKFIIYATLAITSIGTIASISIKRNSVTLVSKTVNAGTSYDANLIAYDIPSVTSPTTYSLNASTHGVASSTGALLVLEVG